MERLWSHHAYLPDVVPELVGRVVLARPPALWVVLQLLLYGAQIHGLLHDLIVVRDLHAERSRLATRRLQAQRHRQPERQTAKDLMSMRDTRSSGGPLLTILWRQCGSKSRDPPVSSL